MSNIKKREVDLYRQEDLSATTMVSTMRRTIFLPLAILLVSCTNTQIPTSEPRALPQEPEGKAVEQRQPVITLGAETAEIAVSAFYNALNMGNGSKAVQYVISEKQETGNYTAAGMSDYYGGLEQSLTVERIDWVGETQRRVVYSYKEQGKEKCQDIMDVYVKKRSSGWFIESIVPRQICKTENLPPEPVAIQPTNTAPSSIDMKIKCQQQGRKQYQDTFFDDGSIEFEFYYSSELDTCLLEREEFGPGTAYAIMFYDLFTKNLLVSYYNGGESMKCTAARALGQDALCVDTISEFNDAKTYLLQ